MHSLSSSAAQPEAILQWLQMEMGYRPLVQYGVSSKSLLPSVESLRKIYHGNMIPIWNFLITRVKSEKTVENIRTNIAVHGKSKGRKKEKLLGESSDAAEIREAALQERDLAEKEVERLRNIVRRQRKDLRARMLGVSREEAKRKRMLDERANYRIINMQIFSMTLIISVRWIEVPYLGQLPVISDITVVDVTEIPVDVPPEPVSPEVVDIDD